MREITDRMVSSSPVTPDEQRLLERLRRLDFGSLEVVKHAGKITEVRTTQKERFTDPT